MEYDSSASSGNMLEACEMEVSLDCVNVSQHELEVIFYVAGHCFNQESNHYDMVKDIRFYKD